MFNFHRTIDDVVDTVRRVQGEEKKCCLLIGAGCSLSAGIPLAQGFVDLIKDEFPRQYNRAQDKTYAACMAELAPGERRKLIARFVDAAKINWAHLALAQLVTRGFVDRVLTTNFDPLVVRACALLNEFPAVYDYAVSQLYRAADIPDKAVFYLHGQRSGFVQLHTPEEVKTLSKSLEPVFDDTGSGRVWIVVGYSGESDPVFDRLVALGTFANRLYWVGHGGEPAAHVRERLLVEGNYAYFVGGQDADSFFITLARDLRCFPPDFVSKPFSHLDSDFGMLTDFTLPGQDVQTDIVQRTRDLVRAAINRYETPTASPAEQAEETPGLPSLSSIVAHLALMAGEYEKVIALRNVYDKTKDTSLIVPLSWAYVMLGNGLSEQAKTKSGPEADALFAQACEQYAQAVAIKPDLHEAFFNCGNALFDQAKAKSGTEADALFAQAYERYAQAVAIKPDLQKAFNNWGNALSEQAKAKSGPEADALFAQAYERYAQAVAIKPDNYEAFYNWGVALFAQASSKDGVEAQRLFEDAYEKVLAAERIRPGSGAYNLACACSRLGKEDECREWLEACIQPGTLPTRDDLLSDPDLENMRERDWFAEILQHAKPVQ